MINSKAIKRNFTLIKLISASDIRSLGTAKIEFKGLDIELSKEKSSSLYIIEEADDLMEKSQKYIYSLICCNRKKLKFILICNNFEKIEREIQQNFKVIYLQKLEEDVILKRFHQVLESEKITYNDNALRKIIEKVNGDLRQGLNYLQSISNNFGEITLKNYNIYFDIFNPLEKYKFLEACFNLEFKTMIKIMENLIEEGFTLIEFLQFFENIIYSYKEKIFYFNQYDDNDIFNILYYNQNFRLKLIQLIQSQKSNKIDSFTQISWICSEIYKVFKEFIKK
jgi:DNA polymerase III gamma/tau subunit